jgi:RraA family protein
MGEQDLLGKGVRHSASRRRGYYRSSARVKRAVTVEQLPTAEIADAAGTPVAMHHRIRPVWRGARLAGPAFTVKTPPGEHRAVREAAEQAPAGSVLVVDGGGAVESALWGDKMSQLALDRGLAGLVIDGAVRDIDGIEALGFPVFAAAIVPTPPAGRDRPGELEVPITSCGVSVRPGDTVYGDADGVVVVPAALLDDVLRRLAATPGTQ